MALKLWSPEEAVHLWKLGTVWFQTAGVLKCMGFYCSVIWFQTQNWLGGLKFSVLVFTLTAVAVFQIKIDEQLSQNCETYFHTGMIPTIILLLCSFRWVD